jgi:hypothetical protein
MDWDKRLEQLEREAHIVKATAALKASTSILKVEIRYAKKIAALRRQARIAGQGFVMYPLR